MAIRVGNERTSGDNWGRYYSDRGEANNIASKVTIGPEKPPGWLLKSYVYASGRGGSIQARVCVWDDDVAGDGVLIASGSQQTWNTSLAWRSHTYSPPVRVQNNRSYWVGFWANNANYGRQYGVDGDDSGARGGKESVGQPASNFRNYIGFGEGALNAYLWYEPNDDPGRGSWATIGGQSMSTSAVTEINTSSPRVTGFTPHPNDGAYDYTDAIHFHFYRADNGQTLWEDTIQTTGAERAAKTFDKQAPIFPTGIEIRARFQHRDSWGVLSDWSDTVRFRCARGPLVPQQTSPIGRLNVVSGYTYAGVYTHDVGRSSTRMRIRLLNATGSQVLYDTGEIAKVVNHGQAWTHPIFHTSLAWGTNYMWEVSFGANNDAGTQTVWGPYARIAFRTNRAPYKPTTLTPGENRDTGERSLIASLADPDNDPITQARIELFDITANAMVTGYPLVSTAITGGQLDHDASGSLIYDHVYRWRVQAADGVLYGEYSDWHTFTFRAAPVVSYKLPSVAGVYNRIDDPSAEYDLSTYWDQTGRVDPTPNKLSPNQSNVETDLTGFSAVRASGNLPTLARDTAQFWQGAASLRITTAGGTDSGVLLPPTPDHQTIPLDVEAVASAYVRAPVGTTIGIRGAMYDADEGFLGYGTRSTVVASGSWQRVISLPYTHATQDFKPSLELVVMGSVSGVVIHVDGMQAEEGLAATDWANGSFGSYGYVNLVTEGDDQYGDAAAGVRSWRAVEGPVNNNALVGQFESIDATKPWIIYTHFKKDSGLSITYFAVDCYNNSNALLGTVYPSSRAPAVGADVTTAWSAYGGIVWPMGHAQATRFPTGTTKLKVRVVPSLNSQAVVRIDGYYMNEVPLFSTTDWPNAQKWFGYIDGDSVEYGDIIGEPQYSWTGQVGNSESYGIYTVYDAGLYAYLNYTHPTGRAKGADRVTIQQAWRGAYVQVAQTDWEGGARTTVPIPGEAIRGDNRYRMRIEVRDTAGIVSQMPWVIFDARFEGPPELNIRIARAEPSTAEVILGWDQTTLGVTDFGGIEVAVGPDREVVELITNPTTTEWPYPYPISGEEIDFWVRQVQNRGADQIESRWDHARVRVDYEEWWLKDVADPHNIALPVFVYSRDEPTEEHGANIASYKPWGSNKTVHIVGAGRDTQGSLTVRILDRDPNLKQKMEVIEQIKERRNVMALLSHRPDRKQFVMITRITQTASHLPFYAVYEMTYEESSYEENYYVRAGVYQSV